MIQIKVLGRLLDVPEDAKIQLRFNNVLLRQFKTQNSRSLTFSLPATNNNTTIFDSANISIIDTAIGTKKLPCELYIDMLLLTGDLMLLSYTRDMFNVCIIINDEDSEFFKVANIREDCISKGIGFAGFKYPSGEEVIDGRNVNASIARFHYEKTYEHPTLPSFSMIYVLQQLAAYYGITVVNPFSRVRALRYIIPFEDFSSNNSVVEQFNCNSNVNRYHATMCRHDFNINNYALFSDFKHFIYDFYTILRPVRSKMYTSYRTTVWSTTQNGTTFENNIPFLCIDTSLCIQFPDDPFFEDYTIILSEPNKEFGFRLQYGTAWDDYENYDFYANCTCGAHSGIWNVREESILNLRNRKVFLSAGEPFLIVPISWISYNRDLSLRRNNNTQDSYSVCVGFFGQSFSLNTVINFSFSFLPTQYQFENFFYPTCSVMDMIRAICYYVGFEYIFSNNVLTFVRNTEKTSYPLKVINQSEIKRDCFGFNKYTLKYKNSDIIKTEYVIQSLAEGEKVIELPYFAPSDKYGNLSTSRYNVPVLCVADIDYPNNLQSADLNISKLANNVMYANTTTTLTVSAETDICKLITNIFYYYSAWWAVSEILYDYNTHTARLTLHKT